jgi:hypothetical protein
MWKRLVARWSRGQTMKKRPPTTSIHIHIHSDDATDESAILASSSSHAEKWEREEHENHEEVSEGQRVGHSIEGSCSAQPAKGHYYAYEPSPPQKRKLHYFWCSTTALQVYFCIFLAIISRDLRFLHGISLALGFQILAVIFKWIKWMSRSSDLRDMKKYFSGSMLVAAIKSVGTKC